MSLLKKLLSCTLLAALLLALPACQTMKGAGKDIEKAGDKIQDAAD